MSATRWGLSFVVQSLGSGALSSLQKGLGSRGWVAWFMGRKGGGF